MNFLSVSPKDARLHYVQLLEERALSTQVVKKCQSLSLQMIQSKIYFNGKRNKTEGKQLYTKNDLAVGVRVGHTI